MLVVNHMKIPNIAKNGLYYVENQYYLWFSGSTDPKLLDPDLGSTDPASVDPDLTDPLGSLVLVVIFPLYVYPPGGCNFGGRCSIEDK